MKRCLVVGAGGFGREALSWAQHVHQKEWEIAGFLDSDPGALEAKASPYPVLGDPDTWTPTEDEVFVSGFGDPETRLRVCNQLKSRGAIFVTVIHPSVIRGLNVEIGEGCVICPNVVLTANVKLGSFVLVNVGAIIGHDAEIGEGTTISCHCDIMGHVTIGRGCFLGSHASILPSKKVGDAAIVGAGSAVVRNVPAHTTVMGVPAQMLRSHRADA
jgi:sugar O-acyltransferase (sialic acid O-acetyltransferase NeuD family)